MNKIIIIIIFTLLYSQVFSQSYDYELPVNVKIRNDAGQVLENKKVNAIFHFSTSNMDLKYCQGIQYTRNGSQNLESLSGFLVFIDFTKWKYFSESKMRNGINYYNKCNFSYYPYESNSLIESTKEIGLTKFNDGTSELMIIGFDGENTLILNFK